MEIHIQIDGTTKGPFSLEQVQKMLLDGEVTLTHKAFIDGKTSWIQLSQIPGLHSDSTVQTTSKNAIGGVIVVGIIFILIIFCCASGQESPEERRVRERQEEMQPLRDEMDRKMREGKTKEEATREIVDDEVRRQERKK